MIANDLNNVNVSRLDCGYAGQEELLRDLVAWLDLQLFYYYSHHRWLGPSAEMRNLLGLVVTREEFEHNLTKAAQRGLPAELTEEEREQIALAASAIRLRLEKTEIALPLTELFDRFGLDPFEIKSVILAYATEISPGRHDPESAGGIALLRAVFAGRRGADRLCLTLQERQLCAAL